MPLGSTRMTILATHVMDFGTRVPTVAIRMKKIDTRLARSQIRRGSSSLAWRAHPTTHAPSSHDELVEPSPDEHAHRVSRAALAIAPARDHPLDRFFRRAPPVVVEAAPLFAHQEHHVAREERDLVALLAEDRLAHPTDVLREHRDAVDLRARVIERPRGDRADHLLSPL